jgi:hypothetical protein
MIFLQVALSILYAVVLSLVVLKSKWYKVDGIFAPSVLGAFYLKLIFGFLFWAVYTYHGNYQATSDALLYFKDAKIVYGAFWENPSHFFKLLVTVHSSDPELMPYFEKMVRWERAVNYGILNDNPTIIKFNAILMFFSLGYFHTHTIVMNFVSFSGLLLLFRFFKHFSTGINSKHLFAAVILPPSLLFWGGGVMKEGLLIFGIGTMLYSFVLLKKKLYCRAAILMLLSILLLVFTKAYVLISIAPAMIFLLVVFKENQRFILLKFLLLHVILAVFVFTLGFWVNDYNVLHMFQSKLKDFYNLGGDQAVGSLIKIPAINNYSDLIINAPNALFNAYFRPHLFEANSLMYVAAAIENLFYMLLLIYAIIKARIPNPENLRLLLFCFSVVLGLGLLTGLITPILGAIVRYKIPALPFLVVFCFILMSNHLASLPSPINWINRFKKS